MTRKLTQTQLKWVAVLFMTVDHIGVYCRMLPAIAPWYELFRILGRIAAPIFLYCMVESVRHTRSRRRLLARLALWNAVTVAVFTAANLLVFLPQGISARSIPGMLMTFLYLTALIMLTDGVAAALRARNARRMLRFGAICAALAALFSVQPHLADGIFALTGSAAAADLFRALVPHPFAVAYTPLFLLLGLAWYYLRDRRAQIAIFLGFNALCIAGVAMEFTRMTGFFNPAQRWMFLAVPFLLLYNGERGRKTGVFFYLYYPLHILALSALGLLPA